jgi:hypothetical protein
LDTIVVSLTAVLAEELKVIAARKKSMLQTPRKQRISRSTILAGCRTWKRTNCSFSEPLMLN